MISAAADPPNPYTRDRGVDALDRALPGLSDDDYDHFVLGRSFFTKPWVEAPAATSARDGLGPLFNANSCVACHRNNSGGDAVHKAGPVDRSIVIRLSREPVYGKQIAINGVHGVPFEARVGAEIEFTHVDFTDGSHARISRPRFQLEQLKYGPLSRPGELNPRRAPALVGLGLIEAVADEEILKRADPEDRDGDGISGRPNRVWSVRHGDWRLGRFGWKASTPSVIEQTAQALIDDMGLTTRWYASESCGESQHACREAYSSSELDVPNARLEAIAFYLTRLQTPAPIEPDHGEALFERIGCAACHRKGLITAEGTTINPYSDFLLHDMGDELADHNPVFTASPREWRTAPLWGLGLAKKLNPDAGYLHDGRANTLEAAILWHGGEAAPARSRFTELFAAERAAIVAFLEAL